MKRLVPILTPESESDTGGGPTSDMEIIVGDGDDKDTSPSPAKISDDLVPADTGDDEETETEEEETTDDSEEETDSSDDETEEAEEPEVSDSFHRRPTVKEIEAKFPGVFKAFPGLKKEFFLAKQYRDVFSTPEEAKEAAERAPLFKAFEQDIIAGNSKLLLNSIKETGGEEALKSFANKFLPTLLELDRNEYVRVTKPLLVGVLKRCEEEGKKLDNKNVQNAAKLIHQMVFGSLEIKDVEEPKEDPRDKQIKDERNKLESERYTEFRDYVLSDGETAIANEITQRADPKKVLSEGIRKYIVRETFDALSEILSKDREHVSRMDRLFSDARNTLSNRNTWQASKTRIINAYLARARAEIPAIAKKLLSEVVKNNPTQRKETKSIPSGGTSRGTTSKNVTVKEAREKKMDAMSIIMAGAKE